MPFPIPFRPLAALAAGAALAVAAGCGGGAPPASVAERNAAVLELEAAEGALHERLRAHLQGAGFRFDAYDTATRGELCALPVLLIGEQTIALYRDAGSSVLTDPTGTVGAKVTGDAACAEHAAAALDAFAVADGGAS